MKEVIGHSKSAAQWYGSHKKSLDTTTGLKQNPIKYEKQIIYANFNIENQFFLLI